MKHWGIKRGGSNWVDVGNDGKKRMGLSGAASIAIGCKCNKSRQQINNRWSYEVWACVCVYVEIYKSKI